MASSSMLPKLDSSQQGIMTSGACTSVADAAELDGSHLQHHVGSVTCDAPCASHVSGAPCMLFFDSHLTNSNKKLFTELRVFLEFYWHKRYQQDCFDCHPGSGKEQAPPLPTDDFGVRQAPPTSRTTTSKHHVLPALVATRPPTQQAAGAQIRPQRNSDGHSRLRTAGDPW